MYLCVVFFLICGTAGAFQDSNENDGLTGLRPLGTAKTNHNAQDEKHRRFQEQAKALAQISDPFNRERLIYIQLLQLKDAQEESLKLKEENAQDEKHRRLWEQAKALAQTSDPFDRERLIYIELLKLKDAQEESVKLREESVKLREESVKLREESKRTEGNLKEENIRLQEEISIILAGNIIEKLEETYGKQFGTEIDRGERWTLMMDLNDPPMLFMSKTANDKGVGIDDLAEIVKKIMRIRDEKVHDQILERKFPNICESFRKDHLHVYNGW
nr:PREDICTED: uncharacterized protein LOC109038326 [Bemisia tabaci]